MTLTEFVERYFTDAIALKQHSTLIQVSWFIATLLFAMVLLSTWRRALRGERWIIYLFGAMVFTAMEPAYLLLRGDFLLFPLAPAAVFFLAAARDLWSTHWRPFSGRLTACILSTVVFLYFGNIFPFQRVPLLLAHYAAVSFFLLSVAVNIPNDFFLRRLRWPVAVLLWLALTLQQTCLAFNPALAIFAAGRSPWDYYGAAPPYLTTLFPLDLFTLVVWAGIGLFLMVGCLVLMARCMMVLSPSERTLKDMTEGNAEYFDPKGVGGMLHAFREQVDADLATLMVPMPGNAENQDAWWASIADEVAGLNDLDTFRARLLAASPQKIRTAGGTDFPWVMSRTGTKPSITLTALTEGRTISSPNWRIDPEYKDRYLEMAEGMHSIICTPLLYNGAAIGVLTLEWRAKRAFSVTTQRRIEQMVTYLAPTVFTRRLLQAFIRLNPHLDALSVSLLPVEANLARITEAVHNVANPRMTCMVLGVGFERFLVVKTGDGCTQRPLRGSGETELDETIRSFQKETPDLHVAYRILKHKAGENEYPVGILAFGVPEARDPLDQPTLVRDSLHREELAARLVNAAFDNTRLRLGQCVRLLNIMFADPELTRAAWLDHMVQALAEHGILWVMADIRRSGQEGSQTTAPTDKAWLADHRHHPDQVIPLAEHPYRGAHSVIRLTLPETDTHLYLGTGVHFGIELHMDLSPWKGFLERLAETADAALYRVNRKETEAAVLRLEAEATRAIFQSLYLHHLGNLAEQMTISAGRALDNLPETASEKSRSLLEETEGVAKTFSGVAAQISRPLNLQAKNVTYSNLYDMLCLVREHYDILLAARSIQFALDVPKDLETSADYPTVFLVFSNLLNNALKAMGNKAGTITIHAESVGEGEGAAVRCTVTDSGPGIPPEVAPHIFKDGYSTREDHTGQGLPGSRLVLRRIGGELYHDMNHRPGARFVVQLPRAPKGDTEHAA